MGLLGKNSAGEEVYASEAGGRYVMRDGKCLAEVPAEPRYSPLSLASDGRFKTVLEAVESVCREHDNGMDGIGAVAALRTMVPYWDAHLAEGWAPAVLVEDLEGLKNRIGNIIQDLTTVLNLPTKAS